MTFAIARQYQIEIVPTTAQDVPSLLLLGKGIANSLHQISRPRNISAHTDTKTVSVQENPKRPAPKNNVRSNVHKLGNRSVGLE